MEMKNGRLPDTIWQRSVLKQVKHRRAEVLQGIGMGIHAAVLQSEPESVIVSCQNTVVCTLPEDGEKALHKTMNYLLAEGAKPIGVLTSILFPEEAKEEELRSFVKKLEEICESIGIEIISAQVEVASAINQPILTLTSIGRHKAAGYREEVKMKPSCELVMTGWAGQEGASLLAQVKEAQLANRFTSQFLQSIATSQKNFSIKEPVEIAEEERIRVMQPMAESGIFGALWELSGRYHLGFEVDLKKIPIQQETIEICEFFDLNPYRLTSVGCLLLAAEHGNELVDKLSGKGIAAVVIGRMMQGNDKKILNEEETHFLEPPNGDELSKVYKK